MATDRYRLALRELTWNPSSPGAELTALVRGRTLHEVARSLAIYAKELGYEVVVVDGRASFATPERFPVERLVQYADWLLGAIAVGTGAPAGT